MDGVPFLLLVEDSEKLKLSYFLSLISSGFDVTTASNSSEIEFNLKSNRFELIVSDTDLDYFGEAPEALRKAISEKYLNDSETFIFGMSDDFENEKLWLNLAHYDAFYDKSAFDPRDLGEIVKNCYNLFHSGIPGWRRKHISCKYIY